MEESADYENVVECLAETGAEMLIVPNGSPYARGKHDVRLTVQVARVTESDLPLVYLNQVGGQDELVFDGASFVLNADRSLAAQLPAFRRASPRCAGRKSRRRLALRRPGRAGARRRRGRLRRLRAGAARLRAQERLPRRAARPFRRHRFGAVRGDRGRCARRRQVARRDAAVPLHRAGVARRCGASSPTRSACNYDVLPIAQAVEGFEAILRRSFAGLPRDITEENLQARARGTMLMAISNKFGAMVVTTGNKSEMSVGYATLYGDMNGGFNPIKDLYKTEVFRLSQLRNRWKPDGALGPVGRGDPGQHHHPAADRGIARKPDRPGFAAALRRARRHPGAAGRARGAARRTSSRPASTATPWRGSTACSTSPNTSAARRRRASR